MKVRDFIEREDDIDVYDNVCEELGIAFCGPLRLKAEGKRKFADVLEYDIDVCPKNCCAVIDVDGDEGVWQKKLKRQKSFSMQLPDIVQTMIGTDGSERSDNMTIYDKLVNAVRDGTKFYIDLKNKTMKIGKELVIDNGCANGDLIGDLPCDPWEMLERLFDEYYNSRPGAWAERKRSYFAARKASDMDELELAFGTPRLVAQAKLEGYVLCAVLSGYLKWNDRFGSWFWASKMHPELVLLKEWF